MSLSALSDAELLSRIAQRDTEAFEALYERHAQFLYNIILHVVKDQGVAESVLQESFWQVWQKAADFEGQGVAAAWLYRIARNKSLDQLRRQKARPQLTPQSLDEWGEYPTLHPANPVETAVEQTLQVQDLHAALNQIPPDQRLCLELAYFGGMSQSQIAAHTQIPLGTIKTRIRTGLQRLERLLRGAGYQNQDV